MALVNLQIRRQKVRWDTRDMLTYGGEANQPHYFRLYSLKIRSLQTFKPDAFKPKNSKYQYNDLMKTLKRIS
jgi:hypothetical protein